MSQDTHMCIRCKSNIHGLSHYLAHRQANNCLLVTADDFFGSLSLRHTSSHINKHTNVSINHIQTDESDEDDREDNISIHSSDDDEDEEDIYRPPRDFTGGKWKPGYGPVHDHNTISAYERHPTVASEEERHVGGKRVKVIVVENKQLKDKEQFEQEDLTGSKTNQLNNSKIDLLCPQSSEQSINDIIPKYTIDNNETSKSRSSSRPHSKQQKNVLLSNDNQIRCFDCDFLSLNHLSLLKHLIEFHSSSQLNQLDESVWHQIDDCQSSLNESLAFSCEPCSFYTNKSNNFLWHIMSTEHSDKLMGKPFLYCNACHYRCPNVKSLLNHLKTKNSIHASRTGNIIVCKQSIFGKNNRKISMTAKQTSKKSERVKCQFCDATFTFRTQLKKHFASVHHGKVAFPNLIADNTQEEVPQELARYSCDKCSYKSMKESSLLLHYINHQLPIKDGSYDNEDISLTKKNIMFKCPKCSKQFNSRNMRFHVFSHTNERPFECSDCGKTFTHINYLRMHKKTHNTIKDKMCHVCGASFGMQKSLNRHMETHRDDREKRFICDVCGSGHHSKSLLALHLKRHIPKHERKYKCTFTACRAAFVHHNELRQHEKVHLNGGSDAMNDDKQLLCHECPYKTKSSSSFRKHSKLHSGIKPFKCDDCSYRTALCSNLTRHKRTHNANDKPYKCPYCDHTCNTHENIRKHILKTKRHAGLSVYSCSHCSFKSNLFSEFKLHLSEKHSQLYSESQLDNLMSNLYCKQSTQVLTQHTILIKDADVETNKLPTVTLFNC